MVKDLRGQILRVIEFLGAEEYKHITADEKKLDAIVQACTFESMKKSPQANRQVMSHASRLPCTSWSQDLKPMRREKEADFLRKGIKGDWQNYFSEEQIKQCM